MRAPSDGPVTAGDLLTLEELGHFRRTSTSYAEVLSRAAAAKSWVR
jgi:hypothetical protein